MKLSLKSLALAAIMGVSAGAQAQEWDSQKFPDYRPGSWNPDPQSKAFAEKFTEAERTGLCPELRLKRDAARRQKRKVEGEQSARPDHVNNGATKYFAPVFNQQGGSCGSASRIGYMFTHEINAFRDLDGSKPENYYPTHFVWLHTYGQSGKNEFVEFVGVPNAKTYGGQTYSSLFGYNDESDPDFGWMTGYDKWLSAFSNRMLTPTTNAYSLATEAGREWAKNWLWNHCGDTDFKAGGLIGLGVASGGQWRSIPKTEANDAAGVTGMYYVHEWGTSVDHALTMVGYDDRVEFDLDGNGVYGEVDKDEVGAWIIVNSWGQWCNGGFIYCPYAFAGASFNNDGNAGSRTFNKNSWWYGELYKVRKNYKPTRTIKVKMDYSHRSELCLSVGVSDNLNATKPDKSMNLHHFIWAGDGNYGNGMKEQTGTDANGKATYKDTKYAPEVPMLGKWADGKMHDEPMEFGYDISDLCANYDLSKPIKVFFMIDSRTKNGSTYAKGSGHLYNLSVIDYSENAGGVETVFDLGEEGVAAIPCKKQLTWSAVMYGDQIYAPVNARIEGNQFQWDAPQKNGRTIEGYNVYFGSKLLGTTKQLNYTVTEDGTYSVAALYTGGRESTKMSASTPIRKQEKNVCLNLKQGNGFTIPEVFSTLYPKATMEFWIRPNSLSNWNNAAGSWGTFMFHCNANGHFTAGWNTNNRVESSTSLKVGQWSHVAMTVNSTTFTLYINGTSAGTAAGGSSYSGLGGFGNLTFSNSGNGYQDCAYDEIRIWSNCHTATAVKADKDVEFSGSIIPDGLLAYYKGDIIYIDGEPYLRDCVGGYHAKLTIPDPETYAEEENTKVYADEVTTGNFGSANVKITKPTGTIYAGVPATFTGTYPDAAASILWNCEGSNVKDRSGKYLTTTFPTPGSYDVTFTAADKTGERTYTATATVEVVENPAPDAAFKASAESVAAGENITFMPVNPNPNCQYEWSMPGAIVSSVQTIAAAAAYEKNGTYTVTLTVRDASGKSVSSSQKVTVLEVAPQPAFHVSSPVAMKGETIILEDASKYAPTSWQWQLQGTGGNIVINGGSTKFLCDHPGVYDVSLTAANGAGRNKVTQEHALVVVNADSKNGLSFSQQSARVTLTNVPFETYQRNYSIEWWMSPTKLSSYCLGIGENNSTFQIRVDGNGAMSLANKSKEAKTDNNFVIPGQWHHYAATVSGTAVKFYRDGVLISSKSTTANLAELKSFSIGTTAADMNGSIDEFRIWNKTLTIDEIKQYANEPISDPKSLEDLLVYYDFNQSGGNVQDRSAKGNTGVRSGFGPDGDAWGLSKGVFSLNFETSASATDITAKTLKNYKRSFSKSTTKVNTSTANRFYAITGWTLENQTVSGSVTTGVHVDTQKSNDFTCTTGWDGFGSLSDHKAFQTVELEPGIYTLSVAFGQHGAAGQSYLVAAADETLPNAADLETAALGYASLADGSVTFVVPETQKVSLGVLVGAMSGNSIFTIQSFKLTQAPLDIRESIVPEGILNTSVITSTTANYSLDGRRIQRPSTPGLYIVNGKKQVLK